MMKTSAKVVREVCIVLAILCFSFAIPALPAFESEEGHYNVRLLLSLLVGVLILGSVRIWRSVAMWRKSETKEKKNDVPANQ